jgi:aromatic ring-opening dioxygenase catalytic subunit (LigB family)
MTEASRRLPTLFIAHGGGPCFFMDWNPPDTWRSLEAWLRGLPAEVGLKPRALLVVSAHWEAERYSVTAHAQPPLIYDYYGFPQHTYELQYPAPGEPALASEVVRRLSAAGLPAELDGERGFDHGVFVPLKLIYPQADIPVVQLSLRAGLNPAEHLAVGAALAPLRDEGVLIVGSGYSYHNMRGYGGAGRGPSIEFDRWLNEALTADPETRNERLRDWERAPSARAAHPREEHLLPLMIAAGAAGQDIGTRLFGELVFGVATSGFRFG